MLNDMKNTSIRNSSIDKKLLYINNKIRTAEMFLGIDTKEGDSNETDTLKSLLNDTTALALLRENRVSFVLKEKLVQNCRTKKMYVILLDSPPYP
jgi:hypothetical protein